MADTHETHADIIAEMRFHGQQNIDAEKDEPEFGILTTEGRIILSYADRLDAAHKRERKASGNAAKLREAMETLRELLGDLLRLGDAEYHNDFSNFCDIIDAALAEPPRNCDRPECKNIQSAMNVYRRECCGDGPLYARKEGAMNEPNGCLPPQRRRKEATMQTNNNPRAALSKILVLAEYLQTRCGVPKFVANEISEIEQAAKAALAEPIRNCEVGTAEE